MTVREMPPDQTITIGPWVLMALAVPVLIVGEWIVCRVRALRRFDLPGPVVSGLLVALVVLAWNLASRHSIVWSTKASTAWWTWLVSAEPIWQSRPALPVYLPLSTAFFTCVGLSASWRVVRTGSWRLLIFWAIALLLGVAQNLLGVGLARAMHQPPVLGLICGSVTLTGGPSTALSWVPQFEQAGLVGAASAGAAAAMFGIIGGSLLGGFVGGAIIRHRRLREPIARAPEINDGIDVSRSRALPILDHVRFCLARPMQTLGTVVLLLVLIKLGAWVSLGIQRLGLTFPVYMGGLLLAIVVRNVADRMAPRTIDDALVGRLGAIALGLFLAAAICSLNLVDLRSIAGPMLVILCAQVVLTITFAVGVTFVVMGRDYDAAVASAGHVGFGLGISANAVATIDVLTATFGPAPRALLVVSLVGAFLIDLGNLLIVGASLKWLI